MTAAVNRLPAALAAQAGLSAELLNLPDDALPNCASLEAISDCPEEARQLGLLLYVVSVVLPALVPPPGVGPAGRAHGAPPPQVATPGGGMESAAQQL